ncbi:hypothetical protein C8J57DRAFT_1525843 [Mycena rebaudengoi]|nr:hypothetical protein C8J57DRAFT_1525843 [Mycena rebaudengoi]
MVESGASKSLVVAAGHVLGAIKPDDDGLDFVTVTSNLRSTAYGALGKTRWDAKGMSRKRTSMTPFRHAAKMAGSIILAIATINTIVSNLINLRALCASSFSKTHNDTYAKILCDPKRTLLEDVVEGLLGDKMEVNIYEDKRVLSEYDWERKHEHTLESLNVARGRFLTFVDEEGQWGIISVAWCFAVLWHSSSRPRKVKAAPPVPDTLIRLTLERSAETQTTTMTSSTLSRCPNARAPEHHARCVRRYRQSQKKNAGWTRRAYSDGTTAFDDDGIDIDSMTATRTEVGANIIEFFYYT